MKKQFSRGAILFLLFSALANFAFAAQNNSSQKQWWFNADYLLWWTKANSRPSLIITGPLPVSIGPIFDPIETVPTAPSFIGLFSIDSVVSSLSLTNATGVLFENHKKTGPHSGARFTLGRWLNCDRTIGIEGSYFFLGRISDKFTSSLFEQPVLAIPFFNTVTNRPDSYLINQPSVSSVKSVYLNTNPGIFVKLFDTTTTDAVSGTAFAKSSRSLQVADINLIRNCRRQTFWNSELILGFRYIDLEDHLNLTSDVTHVHDETTVCAPSLGLPTSETLVINSLVSTAQREDCFKTHNQFYVGQVGFRGGYRCGRWGLSGLAQFGLGGMTQRVDIRG